jgi:hypothetical protein
MADEKQAEKILATGWDEVEKAASSGGSWLKWESGQVHMVNVCGTPVFFEKVWDGVAKRRVRVDVYVPGEGRRIWEMAPGTLRELNEERADAKFDFGDAVFAIKRVGIGKETKFKLRYQRQLSSAELAEREATPTLPGSIARPQEDVSF